MCKKAERRELKKGWENVMTDVQKINAF